jgi:digeranylgeranylglycerophospholipid reductase
LDYDVIVVGAGPSGSTAARSIALGGYNVLLVEEHPKVGIPTHCTGKISVNACRELNLEPPTVLNELRGAIFHSPSGATVTVERKETQAYVVDRADFDRCLAMRAVESGATLSTNSRVRRVVVKESGVSVSLSGGEENRECSCRVLVAADGANSGMARQMGLYTKKTSEVRFGAQKEVSELAEDDSAFAEVFFGREYAPGFFAWLVPTGSRSARVGLAVKPDTGMHPMEYLDRLIGSHPSLSPRLSNAALSGGIVHIIPTGGCLKRTVSKGLLIVGDAAGQVKSTTGGGLYYGMLSAQIAGRAICDSLQNNPLVLNETNLEPYEKEWRQRLGEEIAFGQKTRAFLDSLTDNEVEFLFSLLKDDPYLHQLIHTFADIDYQSKVSSHSLPRLVGLLTKRPRLLYKATRYYSISKLIKTRDTSLMQ